ncbi:MAG: ECF transporter S component [Clostridia bacterium]|nr:ECF transporter S component [Clostridia bacterium]
MRKEVNMNKNLKYIVKIGILSAVAAVLMLFELPLWFAPPFYKLDFSEIPILIGSFALGPLAGVIMELLKNLLNLLMDGTTTAFVGEFANFVTGCAFVLPAALIYKHKKSLKNALVGLAVGTLSLVLVGAAMNYYILVPTFSELYHLPLENIVAMGTAVNASISDLKTLIIFAVMPFNLLKSVACSAVTLLLYKRVSKILHI